MDPSAALPRTGRSVASRKRAPNLGKTSVKRLEPLKTSVCVAERNDTPDPVRHGGLPGRLGALIQHTSMQVRAADSLTHYGVRVTGL
jgi:hypothetical protein